MAVNQIINIQLYNQNIKIQKTLPRQNFTELQSNMEMNNSNKLTEQTQTTHLQDFTEILEIIAKVRYYFNELSNEQEKAKIKDIVKNLSSKPKSEFSELSHIFGY